MRLGPSKKPGRQSGRGQESHSMSLEKAIPLVLVASLVLGSLINYGSRELMPDGFKAAIGKVADSYGFAAFSDELHLRHAVFKLPTYFSRYIRGNDFPTIAIDIKFIDMQKLKVKRQQAMAAGRLVTADDDFVPATIRTDEGTLKAKLRLKGDYLDHLKSSKWSMRIHIKGNDHLFGLRRFSIQHPKTRGFHGEVLFHESLQQRGILTPKYFFVNVIVNGNDQGIMALEEHFSKELIERNGRKEGVIIKLDESIYWVVKTFEKETPFVVNPFLLYQVAKVDTFQKGRVTRSPNLERDNEVAIGLMRGFTNGTIPASEVFDVELLGAYLGVTEFWGVWHEIRWRNQRFYYNPLTMRLEPVAFDGNLHNRLPMDRGIIGAPIVGMMLDDAKVRAVYEQTIQQLTDDLLNGEMVNHLQAVEKPILRSLQSEFFMLEPFEYAYLTQRAEFQAAKAGGRGWIQPRGSLEQVPIYAHAYLVQGATKHYLELRNALPLSVEVRSIQWVMKSNGERKQFVPEFPIAYPFELPPTNIGDSPEPVILPYDISANFERESLMVTFGIQGYEKPEETKEYLAQPMFEPLSQNPMPASTIEEQLERHEFLELDEDGKTVQTKTGIWQIQGSVIIPSGYDLVIGAGTTLQFQENESLIVYGTTLFEGNAEAKVVLEGLPVGEGGSGYWQGIAVYNAPARSSWSYVFVRNTSGVEIDKWRLTGGVTFYKSDVDVTNSMFSGNMAEDALNIVHSDFRMVDTEIRNAASDGLDVDFSEGTIIRGLFEDIGLRGGGDGLDVSGSKVLLEGTRFVSVSDKAISVGEGSHLIARDAVMEDIGIGVASKDGSQVEIMNTTIIRAKYSGLMAYIKKSEYGSTELEAEGMSILETDTIAVSQFGSVLTLDGERVPGQFIDVEKMYATAMKPGVDK